MRKLLDKIEQRCEVYNAKVGYVLPLPVRKFFVVTLPWFLALLVLVLIPVLFLGLTLGSSILWLRTSLQSSFPFLFYISLTLLGVEGVLAARAIPKLIGRNMQGWRLVFYMLLIHAINEFVRWLIVPSKVVGLFWSLLITLAVLYTHLQIKRHYH